MILGFLRLLGLLLLELPVQFIGLFINALTIPFASEDDNLSNDGKRRQYSQYPELGEWVRVRLPKWALWWDNPYDGLLGDKRGWWANECRKNGRTERDFLSMYIWSAIRNPANYFSRKVTGCDVSDCVIEMLAGNTSLVDDTGRSGTSWHMLLATDSRGRKYPRLYGVVPVTAKYMLYFNIGWKLKLDHNGTSHNWREQDRYKGNTFRVGVRVLE